MSEEKLVSIEGLWKRYGLHPLRMYRDWRNRRRHGLMSAPDERDGPWALRGVKCSLGRGECLGVIGPNGSGKSTMLKIIAGVSPATRGKVDVNGRVFPMIELAAGVNPELTGRENALLLATILGKNRREAKKALGPIEDFCDIGPFFDRPVRQYSSGMLARLGFSVGVSSDADILLIDEVIAVGDANFQSKCMEHITMQLARGKTVFFVSHNLNLLKALATSVLVLKKGDVVQSGNVEKCLVTYYDLMTRVEIEEDEKRPEGDVVVEMEKTDEGIAVFNIGEPAEITIRSDIKGAAHVRVAVYSMDNALVFCTESVLHRGPFKLKDGTLTARLHLDPVLLAPLSYYMNVVILGEDGKEIKTQRQRAAFFRVESGKNIMGYFENPHQWLD